MTDETALVPRRRRGELAEPTELLRGRIEKVRYSQGGFSVGTISELDGGLHTFSGKCVVQPGDPVVLRGSWEEHPKYGLQFKVVGCEFDGALAEEGLAHYLAGHPEARGIGPKKAMVIAEHFKGRFDAAIEEEPEEVAKIAGVSLAVIEKLRESWLRGRDQVRCRLFLANLGLTTDASDAIVRAYTKKGLSGTSIKTLIEQDPFTLARDVRGFGFTRADEVARKVGLAMEDPTRIVAGIEHAVTKQLDDGHTWTAYPDLVTAAQNLLNVEREKIDVVVDAMPGPHPDARQMTDGLKEGVATEPKLAMMLDGFRRHPRLIGRATDKWGSVGLSRPDVYEKELAIGRRFYEAGPNTFFSESEAERIARESEGEGLLLGQRRALWMALRWNLGVISGAAGCGKTFVMAKIADAYEKAGAEVVLCAPTGKAAKRMEALSGRRACTIHRMLGYQGHRFTRDTDWFGEGGKLRAGLVCVDELSMVDVLLFWELLECIDLKRTTLVMFGDHHQLPPVGPGSALRDVVERRPIPVIVLDEVVRQAGVLREASTDLLQGKVRPSVWEKLEDGKLFAPWYVADRFEKAKDVGAYCLELAAEVLPNKLGFDPVEVQFLCPMYKGPCGVDRINVEIQRLYQHRFHGVAVDPVEEGKRPRFYVHDRVIQTRNNYDIGVMNGTQGFVRSVEDTGPGEMEVEFDGRLLRIARENRRDLELAYCLSVHRSQGDQWPAVVAVTHSAHSHMLTRNLFYTAVTRASKTAIVVGDTRGIRGAAGKVDAMKRRTWLSVLELPRWG